MKNHNSTKKCVLCDRPHLAKGLCQLHYYRLYKTGKSIADIKWALPPTKRDIIEKTIIKGEVAKVPLYDKKHNIVGYTLLDKDIYKKQFYGVRMNKSNYGYARVGCRHVHYDIIGKPNSRWIFIDHINRNRLDNRSQNLRFVSPKENVQNTSRKVGASGVVGVVYCGREKTPWRATIKLDGGGSKTKYCVSVEQAEQWLKDNRALSS